MYSSSQGTPWSAARWSWQSSSPAGFSTASRCRWERATSLHLRAKSKDWPKIVKCHLSTFPLMWNVTLCVKSYLCAEIFLKCLNHYQAIKHSSVENLQKHIYRFILQKLVWYLTLCVSSLTHTKRSCTYYSGEHIYHRGRISKPHIDMYLWLMHWTRLHLLCFTHRSSKL